MPDSDDIEDYWDVARPDRPAAVETARVTLGDIWKLNKDVLCMGIAVMLNKGDTNPKICAEFASELSRLTKTTLLKLTLLTGVPLKLLNDFNSTVISVKTRRKEEDTSRVISQFVGNLIDQPEEPRYFPIIPSAQVEAARARILQPQTRCSSCGVVTQGQRVCDACKGKASTPKAKVRLLSLVNRDPDSVVTESPFLRVQLYSITQDATVRVELQDGTRPHF